MTYFYEILIVVVMFMAVLALCTKSAFVIIAGISIFIIGCLFEYFINRNKNL